MEFKDKVKTVRSKLSMSQEMLARELMVSDATINRWENGKSMPTQKAVRDFNLYCKKRKISFIQEPTMER